MTEKDKKAKKKSSDGKQSTAENRSSKKDFLVVGIGASAGGVKALQEFFATMPPNSGMAYVVILHLSPEHESNLAHIIQTQTTMPVVQVQETHTVAPDHVYVIPPNHNLEMVDGVVRLAKSEKKRGLRVAIDVFFRTLAEAYARNAVCVVLSGTGSDGTLGLKRVKESNGFAVVQNPSDAEFEEMPRSAIATGLADWVLPVAQMPEKLINFKESSERLHLTGDDDRKVAAEIQAEESLREILTLLRVRTGHDFSNYKTPTLVRRIARHLQIHELEDIPTYLAFLRENPEEIVSLQRNLLINVTNFFRDKEAFAALESKIIPQLFEGKTSRDTVRVWSAGCASGEEAYSLAILLHEYAETLVDPPKLQVFATDVDDEAIAQARENLYPEAIKTDVSEQRLKRFFIKEGKYYRIRKEIRETVLFAPHNLLRDPPFSKLDLITCRNVLIYLNRDTQERIMEIFHFALNPGGYLFLGTSETAENVPNLFSIADKKNRLYSRRPAQNSSFIAPRMPVIGQWQVNLPDVAVKQKPGESPFSLIEVHFKLLEKFAPPSVLVNHEFDVLYMSEEAGRYLKFRGGEPSRNILKLVIPDLLPDLRTALFNAQRERRNAEFRNIQTKIDGEETEVSVIVRSVDTENDGRDFLLVIFDEKGRESAAKREREIEERKKKTAPKKTETQESIVRHLEEELRRTKDNLRATIEQHEISVEELKASNEELQAINEELRSAGEELETSKEEAQSVNEELTTVNSELKDKIDEATRVNSDLQNLIASTDMATIFLDKNLLIKRYTPPIEEIFNITYSDIGRPLEHFTNRLDYEQLTEDARKCLRRLENVEREISDREGNFYLARLAPYRTVDDRIDGVVLHFINITERKKTEMRLSLSEEHFRAFVKASSDVVYSMSADWGEMLFLDGKEFLPAPQNPNDNWIEKYIPEEDKPHVQKAIDKAIRTKSTFELEHCVIRADDSIGWAHSRAIPLLDEKGKIEGWFGTVRDITERRRLSERIRESEEKYRSLFNLIEDGFCTIEVIFDENDKPVDYLFLDVNPAFEKQTGIENAVGKRMRDIEPEHEEFWFETYGRIAQTGEAERFEQRADKLDRFYEVYAFPIGEPFEKRLGIIFNDIQKRKDAAELLYKTEERTLIAIEAAELATWQWNLETNEVIWNDQHYHLFGMKPKKDSHSADVFFNHVHPDDRERVRAELQQAIEEKSVFNSEFSIIREDGSTRWMSGYGRVTEERDGKAVKMSGVMFDITDRKNAQDALRKSEEHLHLMMESVKDYAIITFDLNGKISRWNRGAENIFGWTEKEALGQSTHLIFTPEDRAAGVPEREMDKALRKGKAEDERWHLRKDNSRFFASGVMQLLKDCELEGFVKIARDQTQRTLAEKALREKEMLRQFVRTQENERRRIARDLHDHLGQQLTALRFKIDNLKLTCETKEFPGKVDAATQIDDLQKVAEQIDRDVDFLAWELRPASLDDLGLRLTLLNFVTQWSKYTGIKTDFHSSGLRKTELKNEIETNLYRIAQEALNNIQKHAHAKNVSVLLERKKDELVLIIEDDGIGFNVKKGLSGLTGLGLLGINERAALLGGKFQIESERGKGTAIFIRVPLKPHP